METHPPTEGETNTSKHSPLPFAMPGSSDFMMPHLSPIQGPILGSLGGAGFTLTWSLPSNIPSALLGVLEKQRSKVLGSTRSKLNRIPGLVKKEKPIGGALRARREVLKWGKQLPAHEPAPRPVLPPSGGHSAAIEGSLGD